MFIFQLAAVIIFTLIIIYVSKNSLKNNSTHGFYRFFVFESIAVMIILNIPYWVVDPFSLTQIISWIMLFISLYYLYQSYYFLKKFGSAGKREEETVNFKFENTTKLVEEGIYKYIRHPMYGSLLFLCIGVLLKNINIYTIILGLTAFIFLILTAKTEEKENIKYFGNSYKDYIKRTKMFVPFIV